VRLIKIHPERFVLHSGATDAQKISSAPSPRAEGRDEVDQLFAPLSAVSKGEAAPYFNPVGTVLTYAPALRTCNFPLASMDRAGSRLEITPPQSIVRK
jgi:hypothetical protein